MRIAIMGVAGHNRGDDAIALSLIEALRLRAPNLRVALGVLKAGSFTGHAGVRPFVIARSSPTGLLRLARAVATADAVMLGGGSFIQDRLGGGRIRGILGYGWLVAMLCKAFGKPLITAPIGVDRLNSREGKVAARELLAVPKLLAVRDQLSLEVAREILGSRVSHPITVACDPVFRWHAGSASGSTSPGRVVLAPAFEGRGEEQIVRLFAAIADHLVSAGRAVSIVAMDDRLDEDRGKIERIRNAMQSPEAGSVTLACPASAEEAATLIRGSRGVIAMRLHAMIIGYGHVPMYCISRTSKTEALMAEYAIPGVMIEDADDLDVARRAVDALDESGMVERHRARSVHLAELLDCYYDQVIEVLGGRSIRPATSPKDQEACASC